MAVYNLAGSASGNTGALGSDTKFAVESGEVLLSTDAGTTYEPYWPGKEIIFTAGLTVHYLNQRPVPAILKTSVV